MRNLIDDVIAQAEPTFPYEGPFEETNPEPSENAIIKLSSNYSQLEINKNFSIDIEINSGNQKVKSYALTITFNPQILEVIDSDSFTSGIQINFTDTFSTVGTNSVNNSTGKITITASVNGEATTINRRIGQINLRTKAVGTSIVSIDKSLSNVTSRAGANIIGSTTSLNFTVTGQSGIITPTTTTTQKNATLPSSGFFDNLASISVVTIGIIMVYIGVRSIKENEKSSIE